MLKDYTKLDLRADQEAPSSYIPDNIHITKATCVRLDYPINAVGLSSSWHTENDPTNRSMALTSRRRVSLHPTIGPSIWHPISDGIEPPFAQPLIKTEHGSLTGLSSGAGSALILDGTANSLKLKRCGLQDGSRRHRSRTRSSVSWTINKSGLCYTSSEEPLGGMWKRDAERELQCQLALRHAGFSAAYEPLGYWAFPSDTALCAFRVTSDLRADELFLLIATVAVVDSHARVIHDVGKGSLLLHDVEPQKVFSANSQWSVFLEMLGSALGGLYRQLFDAGFLRGIGNAWFGNEVIGSSGLLSVVDLDEMVLPSESSSSQWRLRQQDWEWRAYVSTLYSYIEMCSTYLLSYAASLVASAAEQGFRRASKPDLSQEMLDTVLTNFDMARGSLWRFPE